MKFRLEWFVPRELFEMPEAAEKPRLTRFLVTWPLMTPFVGFVGTVCAMFVSFREIASSPTSPTVGQLAGGIVLALKFTVLGIIVALPLALIASRYPKE